MLLELAKMAAVSPDNIYGTCSGKNKAIVRQAFGNGGEALHLYDYTATPNWHREILASTNQRGVDLIFDSVILQGYYGKGMSCLARGGKYIGYGVTNTAQPGVIGGLPRLIGLILRMSLQQSLWSWFDGRETEFYNIAERRSKHPQDFAADVQTLMDAVATKRLQPVIGKVWRFEEGKAALQSIAKNAHTGKQIVHVSDA